MGRSKGRVQHRSIEKAIEAGVSRALAQMNGTPYAQTRQLDPNAAMGMGNLINALTTGAVPMPRNPLDMVAFGPNWALPTQPLDPSRRDTDRPEPRLNQYPVAWNIPGNGQRAIPWETLRAAADNVDIMRRCIEVRKEQMRGLKWAVTLDPDVVTAAYDADGKRGRMDIEAELRQQYLPEIQRCTEFWAKPWRSNGVDFGQWINAFMEDHLVLDAVAIYPQMSYGGDLLGLELIDGATIKPLLDYRGSRPRPPFPAFQQNLWGYPRSEFTSATVWDERLGEIENPELGDDAKLTADQLFYYRSNFRTTTPYGFSAVEQALISARLYLKRQGWMLAEYDDGSTPLMWLVPEATPQVMDYMTAQNRADYERSINDKLTGNTAARHRIKLTPPGMTPMQMESVDERYKPDYDMHLIKLLAGFFGVTATGLGFSESRGLGNSGLHEGQENVQDKATIEPDRLMLEGVFNELSHGPLRMPKELRVQFIDPDTEDSAAEDATADAQRKRGTITLNEDRKRLGLAPSDIPEADALMVEGGPGGWTALEGMIERAQQTAANEQALVDQQMAVDSEAVDEEDVAKSLELAAYSRWRRRRGDRPGRPFVCKSLEPDDFPAGVPDDVDFELWEWVPDDATDEEITKAAGNDHWRVQLRDRKGRWVKMGTHGPALPGKAVLAGLAEQAKRDRAERQLRVNDASSTLGSMSTPETPKPMSQSRAATVGDVRVAVSLKRGSARSVAVRHNGEVQYTAYAEDGAAMDAILAREVAELSAKQAAPQVPVAPKLTPKAKARLGDMALGGTVYVGSKPLTGEHAEIERAGYGVRNGAYLDITDAGRAAAGPMPEPTRPEPIDYSTPAMVRDARGSYERSKRERLAREAKASAPLPTAPAPAGGKRTFRVTLPDGTVATRQSARPYTHAVVVEVDNIADAARQQREVDRMRDAGVDEATMARAQASVDALRAKGPVRHGTYSFHASEAAAQASLKQAQNVPHFKARVVPVDSDHASLPTPPAEHAPEAAHLAHVKALENALQERHGEDWENVELPSEESTAYARALDAVVRARSARMQAETDPVALADADVRRAREAMAMHDTSTPQWRSARDAYNTAVERKQLAALERGKATPERAFGEREREDALREAAALHRDEAGQAKLANVRAELHGRGMSRADQDAALTAIALRQDAVLWPQENQKLINAADRDSALRLGGEDKHLISVERDSRSRMRGEIAHSEGQRMADADRRDRAASGITDEQAAANRKRFGRRDAAPTVSESPDLKAARERYQHVRDNHEALAAELRMFQREQGGKLTDAQKDRRAYVKRELAQAEADYRAAGGDPDAVTPQAERSAPVPVGAVSEPAHYRQSREWREAGKTAVPADVQAAQAKLDAVRFDATLSHEDHQRAVADARAEPEAAEAPKLSKRQRDIAAQFDKLAGEHATDPKVSPYRERAVELVGQMERGDDVRDQMSTVQDEFTHAMTGARAAAAVRDAGGDDRAQAIARTRATLDSRARKVTDRINHLERQVKDYTGETRKTLRKRLNDAKAERQRYLDRIESAERDHDTKLHYDADGKLTHTTHEPPKPEPKPIAATHDERVAALARHEQDGPDYIRGVRDSLTAYRAQRKQGYSGEVPLREAEAAAGLRPLSDVAEARNAEVMGAVKPPATKPRGRLTSKELSDMPMSAKLSREAFRAELGKRGWSDADVDAELESLGMPAQRPVGGDKVDLVTKVHWALRERADEEGKAAMRKATPGAYAKLLDQRDSASHVEHAPSRKVFEAMRAGGWELTGGRAGGVYTWTRGDQSMSTAAPSGHGNKGNWTFWNGDRKLTYAAALEHAGGAATVAKPTPAALRADTDAMLRSKKWEFGTVPHTDLKPGTRVHVGGRNFEILSAGRKSRSAGGGTTYTVKRDGGYGEDTLTFRDGETVDLAPPKAKPKGRK